MFYTVSTITKWAELNKRFPEEQVIRVPERNQMCGKWCRICAETQTPRIANGSPNLAAVDDLEAKRLIALKDGNSRQKKLQAKAMLGTRR